MSMNIACHGKTDYIIYREETASPSEQYAAKELAGFLNQISGAIFPVQVGGELPEKAFVVGFGAATEKLGLDAADFDLGKEGYIIKTLGDRIVIAGGALRGTMYGVYSFLEDLGCRWFSAKVSHIPTRSVLKVKEYDIRKVPVMEYRESYWSADSTDGVWAARNKDNGMSKKLNDEMGGQIIYNNPFVHSFNALLSTDEYFAEHPEYFSLVNGERCGTDWHTQLCLTNPDVVRIAIEKVKGWLRANPKVNIVSISQNDWYNFCECPNCKAIDDYNESHAGTLITFVNQIAEAIEPEFPDVVVDTLAYQYTRPAPKHVKPRHNVCVRICSIECCFAHPLADCDEICSFADKVHGDSFQHDLKEWGKICNRIYVWDYVVNFSHYFMPFPNFHVLQPNMKFFIENNVKGLFEEGATAVCGKCELAECRSYVLTHLMWDPDADTDALVAEFMAAWFGEASAPIMEYYNLIHNAVKSNPDVHFGIYDPPRVDYLSGPVLEKSKELFDRAEALADNDEILERVEIARLPIRYFELMYQPVGTAGRAEAVEQLFRDFQRFDINEIWEGRTMEQARERMDNNFKRRWE